MHQGVAQIAGIAITLALAIPWLIALDDVLRRDEWEFPSLFLLHADRRIWVIVVVLGSVIGSIAYYFMVMGPYPRRRR